MSASPGLLSAAGDGTRVGLDELIALRQTARLLDLTPHAKVVAARSGGHLSRFRGRGMEFDESRVYQPGDEPRNMDWRVTARSGRPHVKLFREERERPVWLLVDQGSAMRFGTRVAFKSVVAARAAALLGWAASDIGDRVGGMVFNEVHASHVHPAAGNRGLLPLLHALSDAGPIGGEHGFETLAAAGSRFAARVHGGSLVFVVSDFHGLHDDNVAWMARLGRTGELVLVNVFDPLEVAPPPPGRYAISDGSQHALLDAGLAGVRQRWGQAFDDLAARLERLCLRYRAHLVNLRSDRPLAETLRQGLGPRRGAGWGRR